MTDLEEQIRALYPVSSMNRNTIADGDAFNLDFIIPLNNIDSAIMSAVNELSGNAYLHDPVTNSIYHYKDNDTSKQKVYSFSAQSFSSENANIQNLTANNVTSTDITTNNLTANGEVNVVSANNADPNTLKNIVDYLLTNWRTLYNFVATNSANWSSISAISASNMTAPFTGNTFTLSAGKDVSFTATNDTLTIGANVQNTIYTELISTDQQGNNYYRLVIR